MKTLARTNYPQHEFLYNLVVGDGIDSVDVTVERLLFALSFRSKLDGTVYIKEAIALWFSMPVASRVVLSTDIYPQVAAKLNSTAERVERNIRTAIHDCHGNGKLVLFNDLAQSEIILPHYVPTNAEFLSSVVSWLRIQCREQNRQMSLFKYIDR